MSAERPPKGPPQAPPHADEAAAALERARALLAGPGPLDEKTRGEILASLRELEKALRPALAAKPAEARSVSQFAEAAVHEATQPAPSGSILGTAIDGLNQTAERLEVNYPTVAGIVERLADLLAQIGI
jgi:hypothetical protein